jgi:centromere/kinetochore protein ZW10
MMDNIPVERTTRAIRLLDDRCFELRTFIHEQLTGVWQNLVYWDEGDKKRLTIRTAIEGEHTNMDDAVISWRAFKELDTVAKQLWQDLDDNILKPRTDIRQRSLRSIQILDASFPRWHNNSKLTTVQNTLSIDEMQADNSIKSLFDDLERVVQYLLEHLPNEVVKCLSEVMMPTLFTRIKEQWLDSAVPSSLDDMDEYQKSLAQVNDFAVKLESLSWPAAGGFYDWVSNSHRIWLSKRKEIALDWIRNQLALGRSQPPSPNIHLLFSRS